MTLLFQKLWSSKLQDSINCLAVGKPFLEELSEENDILIGTTAGRVLILNETKVDLYFFYTWVVPQLIYFSLSRVYWKQKEGPFKP
jgi:hypothetical protein